MRDFWGGVTGKGATEISFLPSGVETESLVAMHVLQLGVARRGHCWAPSNKVT